jgi:hypothetical protein
MFMNGDFWNVRKGTGEIVHVHKPEQFLQSVEKLEPKIEVRITFLLAFVSYK